MMPNDSVAEVVRLVVITWSGSLDLTTAVTVQIAQMSGNSEHPFLHTCSQTVVHSPYTLREDVLLSLPAVF